MDTLDVFVAFGVIPIIIVLAWFDVIPYLKDWLVGLLCILTGMVLKTMGYVFYAFFLWLEMISVFFSFLSFFGSDGDDVFVGSAAEGAEKSMKGVVVDWGDQLLDYGISRLGWTPT